MLLAAIPVWMAEFSSLRVPEKQRKCRNGGEKLGWFCNQIRNTYILEKEDERRDCIVRTPDVIERDTPGSSG
jgi:hypothetical protein